MTITPQNIKLLKAEVQDDTDDGGGQATSIEVVDGVSNNLFPDIPESSRVYGKIEFRKIYPAVLTSDTDVLFGAQFLFTEMPQDEKVNVCAFTTNSWNDVRKSAQSMLENYLAAGTLGAWEVLEKQLIGQRAVLLMSDKTASAPTAGQSLLLIQNEGLTSEFYQYVRILKVTTETRTFYKNNNSNDSFELSIHTCEITDPLTREFTGWTPQEFRNGQVTTTQGRSRIRETRIADASKYYSSKKLTRAVAKGEATIQVDSIYTNLVPSTQSEAPLSDLNVAGAFTGLIKGSAVSNYNAYLTVGAQSVVSLLGSAIMPDTLVITLADQSQIKDNGVGMLFKGQVQVGTIQYDTGVINWIQNNFGYNGNVSVSYAGAFPSTQFDQSDFTEVTEVNNGRVWNLTLNPKPAKGSLRVTYINSGKKYQLFDNGDGSIGGVVSGVGVGVINYDTGTVTLTLAAYPDIGSNILYQWGDRIITMDSTVGQDTEPYILLDTTSMVELFNAFYKLQNNPTLTWSVQVGNQTVQKTAVINKSTLELTGDATGLITAGSAKIFPLIPTPIGTQFTLSATSVTGGDPFTKVVAFTGNSAVGSMSLGSITEEIDPWTIKGTLPIEMVGELYAYARPDSNESLKQEITELPFYISGFKDGKYSVSSVRIGTIPEQVIGTYNASTKTIDFVLDLAVNMYMPEVVQPNWSFSTYTYTKMNNVTQHIRPVNTTNNFDVTIKFTSNQTAPAVANRTLPLMGYGVDVKPLAGYDLDPRNVSFVLAGYKISLDVGLARTLSINGVYTNVGTYTTDSAGVINIVLTGLSLTQNTGKSIIWNNVGLVVRDTPKTKFAFYTPIAPIRNGSFQLRVKTNTGYIEAVANSSGLLNENGISGKIDYQTGFVVFVLDTVYRNIPILSARSTFDTAPYLGDNVESYSGLTSLGGGLYDLTMPRWAYASDVSYNAVGLSYLPLSKDILGIDPVRLPADGRVPCFRAADMIVITEKKEHTIANPVAGSTFSVGETRISTLEIRDQANTIVTGYVTNLSSGTGVFDEDFDSSQLLLPLTVKYSIQDLCLIQDVQVSGTIVLNKVLAHDYSAGCLVSSVVFLKDLKARAYNKFHQAAWTGVWSDERIGQGISANYNTVFYPFVVTNDGAVKERWAIIFIGSSAFKCIGEFIGELTQQGSISEDYAPINPMTMKPYFTIKKEGWGAGWANGYVTRFNTDAANFPIWVVRTILQGESTDTKQHFTMQLRGDIDNEEP